SPHSTAKTLSLCHGNHHDKHRQGRFFELQAVNGVPAAMKDEAVVAVKGEPVVAVRVELKWSHPLCYSLRFRVGQRHQRVIPTLVATFHDATGLGRAKA